MDALRVKFDYLKKAISKREQEDREFRVYVHRALIKVFGASVSVERSVKELSKQHGIIRIVAANKTYAQELFLKKEAIRAELAKHEAYAKYDVVIA